MLTECEQKVWMTWLDSKSQPQEGNRDTEKICIYNWPSATYDSVRIRLLAIISQASHKDGWDIPAWEGKEPKSTRGALLLPQPLQTDPAFVICCRWWHRCKIREVLQTNRKRNKLHAGNHIQRNNSACMRVRKVDCGLKIAWINSQRIGSFSLIWKLLTSRMNVCWPEPFLPHYTYAFPVTTHNNQDMYGEERAERLGYNSWACMHDCRWSLPWLVADWQNQQTKQTKWNTRKLVQTPFSWTRP